MSDSEHEKKFADASQADPTPKLVTPEVAQLKELVRTQAKLQSEGLPGEATPAKTFPAEALAELPRVGRGILGGITWQICLGIVFIIVSVVAFVASWRFSWPSEVAMILFGLATTIPLQLVWARCLERIGNAVKLATGKSAALLQPRPLMFLSLLNSAVLVLWLNRCSHIIISNHPLYLFASALQWLFVAIPVIVIFFAGKIVGRAINDERRTAGIAMLPSVLTAFLSIVDGNAGPSFVLWPLVQFGAIIYLCRKMRRFASAGGVVAVAPAVDPVEKPVQQIGEEIVVRHHAFPEVERWFKQRIEKTAGMPKRVRYVLAYSLGLVALLGATKIATFLRELLTSMPAQQGVANGQMNVAFIFWLLALPVIFFASIIILKRLYPTHIAFGAQGIRQIFGKNLKFKRPLAPDLRWGDVKHIALSRPPGKTSPLDDVLEFDTGAPTKIKIRMASIDSIDAREAVLNCIQRWGGDISRDATVMQALQPPADHSYTELWLQALAAPPKRERLKPLLNGGTLRDGRYRVQRSLGVGGQGQAYLADDLAEHGEVVLKEFILPVFVDVTVRRTALEQFENEARILRQLEHPQIVKLKDFFIEDHRAYLVLEHINGASLRQIVEDKGKLPEAQVRQLAQQMCRILAYLHSLEPPVVHRDFTPDNLILDQDGNLKLIDFNVAKQIESTTVGTVVGKYAYLPPEQFRGMPNVQSDLYAMGATLHYLLTGQDPEPISTSHPILINNQVSGKLDEIVAKATAVDLSKRYVKAEEIAADLSESREIG